MESVMILQFVESLQFLKVLVSLVRTQFKPISTQFKALKFFLEGSAPEDPRWGGLERPQTPQLHLGALTRIVATLTFSIGAWRPQL